jgi:hypothetical protein
MIVTFTTAIGSKYHIDHTNHTFVQELPVERTGPLYNTPSVVVGKRVEIWTAPTEPGQVARVMITSPVRTREVSFA